MPTTEEQLENALHLLQLEGERDANYAAWLKVSDELDVVESTLRKVQIETRKAWDVIAQLEEENENLRWHLAHAMIHAQECDCTPENQQERQALIAAEMQNDE